MKYVKLFEDYSVSEAAVPKYIAKDKIRGKDVQLTVLKSDLVSSKLSQLVSKLNKAGWNLGSGHDSVELDQDDKYFKYTLTLVPYVGAPTQQVVFSLLK
jgi:UDP-N-acetylglucosamine enolpyruvyl transferase